MMTTTKRRPSSTSSTTTSSSSSAHRHELLRRERRRLPIFPARDALIRAVQQHQCVIVVGETGSGKTTQIPQYLYESHAFSGGMIGVTQPRRVAAIAVARRVAEEVGVPLGDRVGYTIRFDDCSSPTRTRIKYLTDGMMLRELHGDRSLSAYSVIILDEAHERTIHTDILFALVKQLMQQRRELRVVIMSATLQADAFSAYMGNAPVLYVSGRQYPVQVMYTKEPENDYVDAATVTTLQVHLNQPLPGDILVFLTGQDEIEVTKRLLLDSVSQFPAGTPALLVTPIYAALPAAEQMKVFEPTPRGCRKVVLATNIAETSVTIDGIQYVVDTGVVKIRQYYPRKGVEALSVVPVSQAEAWQRCGRAGRREAGVCYRLYTEALFMELRETLVPEILRCNLANVVLQLKALRVHDVLSFDFLDPPPVSALVKALEHLYALEALDTTGHLTSLGEKMALLPIEPAYARTILASVEFGCTAEVLTIVSVLSGDSIFFTPGATHADMRAKATNAKHKFASLDGDHLTMLNVYGAFTQVKHNVKGWCSENYVSMRNLRKVQQIRQQLVDMCARIGINGDDGLASHESMDSVRRCMIKGLFMHVACLEPDGLAYRTLKGGQTVYIHPSSVLMNMRPPPPCVLYTELILTTKPYMRDLTVVDMAWLPELVPRFYSSSSSS